MRVSDYVVFFSPISLCFGIRAILLVDGAGGKRVWNSYCSAGQYIKP